MILDFIISSLRKVCFAIDNVVFGLIDDVYGLLLQLTRTSIFSQDVIHEFATRIYAIVGIFMLFKVSISLITYVLNPDDFSNEEKGFASIIKHVVLSLVMIVLVPYVFNEAYELQAIILEENTIMNLVFGSPTDRKSERYAGNSKYASTTYAEEAGAKIQFTLLYAFTQPNYEEFSHDGTFDLIDCKRTYATDSDGNYLFREKPVFENVKYDDSSKTSNYIYKLRESCWGVYNPEKDMYEAEGDKGQLYLAFSKGMTKSSDDTSGDVMYQNYAQGVAQQSFSLFFRKNIILAATEDGRYLINYKFGVSTVVGAGTLYLLLVFCIDIAVRSVKLGFLQMIAPIPILSYCDPKKGKDGGMFSSWIKACKDTYLELFLRLFALYFGIYVISLIGTFRDVTTGQVVDNLIVNVFMIIGILIFIKQLPKIIEQALGVKASGTFQPNILKKLEDDAFGGKRILGAASGAAVGAVGNAVSRIQEGHFLEAGPALLAGALRGAAHGAIENKGLTGQAKRQAEMNQKIRQARLNGTNFFGRIGDSAASAFGAETPSERYERMSKTAEARLQFNQANLDYVKNTRSTILSDLQSKSAAEFTSKGMHDWVSAQDRIRRAEDELTRLQNSGTASQAQITAARENVAIEREAAIDQVINAARTDPSQESGAMRGERMKYNTRVQNSPFAADAGIGTFNTAPDAATMKALKDNSQGHVTTLEQEVYRYKNSSKASQYQGDRTYNDANKFN